MLQVDAIRILARLKAAFPTMALTEPQTEVLLNELCLLHDPSVLDEAVSNLIHSEDRFPAIARIRSAYRSVNDRRAMQRQALEASAPAPDGGGAPEWVAVWSWWREKTHSARVEANPANKGKRPEDRLPLEMRDFPQVVEAAARDREMGVPSPSGSYSVEEYDRIRAAWVDAGSPLFGGVVGMVGELVGATA